jgi:hypothetical protein
MIKMPVTNAKGEINWKQKGFKMFAGLLINDDG